MKVSEKAYMAGFFEADGTVCIIKARNEKLKGGYAYSLRVQVGQNVRRQDVIWFFNTRFEGHTRFSHDYKHLDWQIVSNNAKKFLLKTYPFLLVKKDHAQIAIAFQIVKNALRGVAGIGRGPNGDDVLEFYEQCHQAIKSLNNWDMASVTETERERLVARAKELCRKYGSSGPPSMRQSTHSE